MSRPAWTTKAAKAVRLFVEGVRTPGEIIVLLDMTPRQFWDALREALKAKGGKKR